MSAPWPIMSVSGIRGIVGESLTPTICAEVAYIQTTICGGGDIVIARDTRPSGVDLAQAVFAGIHAAGGRAIDVGIATTPSACVAVEHLKAAGGIILTASHNPASYNGYKMVHSSGRLFNESECQAVYSAFCRGAGKRGLAVLEAKPTHSADAFFNATAAHIDRIAAAIDQEKIRKARLTICFDAINGTAGVIIPLLLKRLGVTYYAINEDLSGNFKHNPEPRIEYLSELARLCACLPICHGGFAFDPDADRLITMGEKGEPVSEEFTLAFALQHVLSKERSNVATNLSTSMVIDDVASDFGAVVYRTKIGEANVVETMLQQRCSIGGEGNGGVIYPRISTVRDGPAALALILELIATTGLTISQLADRLPHYYMVKEKIPLAAGTDPQKMIAALCCSFAAENIDTQDGIKIIRPRAWVHLRPSNTEPILRCYAEAPSEKEARSLIANVLRICASISAP